MSTSNRRKTWGVSSTILRGDDMITESKKQMQAIMQIDAKLDEISELLGQIAMSKEDAHDMQGILYQFYSKLEEVTIWP